MWVAEDDMIGVAPELRERAIRTVCLPESQSVANRHVSTRDLNAVPLSVGCPGRLRLMSSRTSSLRGLEGVRRAEGVAMVAPFIGNGGRTAAVLSYAGSSLAGGAREVLRAAGMDFSHVTSVTVYQRGKL